MGDGGGKHESEERRDRDVGGGGLGSAAEKHGGAKRAEKSIRL